VPFLYLAFQIFTRNLNFWSALTPSFDGVKGSANKAGYPHDRSAINTDFPAGLFEIELVRSALTPSNDGVKIR
jgi:hypothetical protein